MGVVVGVVAAVGVVCAAACGGCDICNGCGVFGVCGVWLFACFHDVVWSVLKLQMKVYVQSHVLYTSVPVDEWGQCFLH